MTTQSDIEELCTDVKWHGRYFAAACPFGHTSHTYSLMVYEDGFLCLSCDKKGSLDYLLKTMSKSDRPRPIVENTNTVLTPPWNKWKQEYGSYEQMVASAIEQLTTFKFFRASILARGISHMTIERARLGYLDGWIVFPCFDEEDNLVDITVRHSKQRAFGNRPRFSRDESTHVLCPDWELVKHSRVVHLPFGLFDCLSFLEVGLPTMTGISGKSIQANLLPISKQVLIYSDYNEEANAMKLMQSLGWRGRKINLPYPDDCKDPNDVLKKYGKEYLKEIMKL